MKWSELTSRNDIVGGILEAFESGTRFRGPIEAIEVRGFQFIVKPKMDELLVFNSIGPGKLFTPESSFGGWSVHMEYASPILRDDGSVSIHIPYIGTVHLYPIGVPTPN
jgi:hypothetical protein